MNWIKRSLFVKLLIAIVGATAFPFILSNVIAYRSNSSAVKREVIALGEHSMHIALGGIRRYLGDLTALSVSFYGNPALFNYLHNPEPTPSEDLYISQQMTNIYATHLELKAVAFTSAVSGRRYVVNNQGIDLGAAPPTVPKMQNGSWTVTKEFRVSRAGGERILLLNRLVVDFPTPRVLGMISLYVGLDEIRGMIDVIPRSSDGSVEFLLIQDAPQLLVQSDVTGTPGDDRRVDEIASTLKGDKGFRAGRWKGQDGVFIFTKDAFRGLPLALIRFVPDATINRAAIQTLNNSLVFQLAAIVFVIALVALVSYYMIVRIRRIMAGIARVQSGDFEIVGMNRTSDELGRLEERFHKMVQQLDVMINKEYRSRLELSTAQLTMLQSQINPHFLYNTLQSLSTIALDNGVTELNDKISQLGDMFRYSMDTKTEVVRLETELHYVESYLSLQAGRFADKMSYSILCPPGLTSALVPKMILQPLVENSIVHGIEQSTTRRSVKVLVQHDGRLNIRVVDDGSGIDPGIVRRIEEGYNDRQLKTDSRIGVLNVLHRLFLFYGRDFSWKIESVPFQETVVSLYMPLRLDGESEP